MAQTATLVASAARTTTGNTAAIPGFGTANTMRVQLNVTAASGTAPTLDVVIQDTIDGTNWNNVGTFTQIIAAGRQAITVTAFVGDQVRVLWTIGGTATPSFTFDVIAQVE